MDLDAIWHVHLSEWDICVRWGYLTGSLTLREGNLGLEPQPKHFVFCCLFSPFSDMHYHAHASVSLWHLSASLTRVHVNDDTKPRDVHTGNHHRRLEFTRYRCCSHGYAVMQSYSAHYNACGCDVDVQRWQSTNAEMWRRTDAVRASVRSPEIKVHLFTAGPFWRRRCCAARVRTACSPVSQDIIHNYAPGKIYSASERSTRDPAGARSFFVGCAARRPRREMEATDGVRGRRGPGPAE